MQAQLRSCSHHYASTTQRGPLPCDAAARRGWTAAPPAPSRLASTFRRGPYKVEPARLTNTQDELDPYRTPEDDFIDISQLQIPNPEEGPLERRVNLTYLEALESELTSNEDMEYWFEPPPGGWNQEPIRYQKAKEAPYESPTGRNFGAGRIPIDRFYVGQEIRGEVSRIMLYNGAQVDFGADFDGLVPIIEAQWVQGVRERITVGTQVRVRIHAMRDPNWFRFPVQLELLDPDMGDLLSPPEDHEPPLDLRGKPPRIDAYMEATGRPYNAYRFWAPLSQLKDVDAGDDSDDDDDSPEVVGKSPEFAPSLHRDISKVASFM